MKRFAIFILCLTIFHTNIHAQQWLHHAVPDGRVDSVWNGYGMPQGFSGKGVIIGFTDWGFDYTHPVFYDTSMTNYRVLAAWDQFRNAGPAPEGFNYGTEITGKEALLAAQCDTSNVYQYDYHGNHVASIAGGAGAGTAYRGVAYDADLLFASFLIDEKAVTDAFIWMYNIAKKEQKRLVINMSWGLYYMGNMDGTGMIADVMQNLSDSGVVFVTSGGNNGTEKFHLHKQFTSNTDTLKSQLLFDKVGESHTWGQAISMLSTPGCAFQFAIQAMDKQFNNRCFSGFFTTDEDRDFIDTFMVFQDSLHNDTLHFNMKIEKSNSYNNRPQVLLKIQTVPADYTMGLHIVADSGDFHAWNVVELTNGVGNWGDDFVAPIEGWTAGDNQYGIGQPAAVPCALSIASHHAIYKWGHATRGGEISSFSSSGPCLNGLTKPEISAPGQEVIAAISSFTNRFNGSYTQTIQFQDRDYGFAPLSGTSMSSPFAAGVVALMLQANPYLTVGEVKEIITGTAYQDYDTRLSGVNRFGYGKINAYEAVIEALEKNGTQSFSTAENRYIVYPNPTSDLCHVSCLNNGEKITAQLYDMQGRLLKSFEWSQGVQSFSLQQFSKGCYLLRLNDGKIQETIKIIKK